MENSSIGMPRELVELMQKNTLVKEYVENLQNQILNMEDKSAIKNEITDLQAQIAQEAFHAREKLIASNIKILLAEDNKVSQKLITQILHQAGFLCDIANNGEEAVLKYLRKDYDLILMDCLMPTMNGFKATQTIRGYEKDNRHTPIIALSANAFESSRDFCLKAGMDDYLDKTFDTKELLTMVFKWLDGYDENHADQYVNSLVLRSNVLIDRISHELHLDKVMALELWQDFMEYFGNSIKEMGIHIQDNNFEALGHHCHSLKGAAANLRVKEIQNQLFELEVAARIKDKDLCQSLLTVLENTYNLLK